MNRLLFFLFLSVLMEYPYMGFAQSSEKTNTEFNRVLIQAIGEKDLPASTQLIRYDEIAKSKFDSYPNKAVFREPLYDSLKVADVVNCLENLSLEAKGSDIVILHVISHGSYDEKSVLNNKFDLICKDGNLNGEKICSLIQSMTSKGTFVIFLLDACQAEGIFKNVPDFMITSGGIAFYASSKYNQKSTHISSSSLFTNTIFSVFENEDNVTLESLNTALTNAFKRNNNQNPYLRILPEVYYVGDDNILDYPIINLKATKESIAQESRTGVNPPPTKNNRFYGGIAIGTNHTPTLFGDINIGFDLKHIRVEAGASIAFTTSEDVYIYNTNGILQNTYNYRSCNFYGRIGYDIMSCFKEKTRWELVPLVGISGNYISGKQQDGFNSDIGKDATSLMLSANCRFAYDLTNKGRFFLQGTLGYDFALDNNTKVLGESKYIKNWCKSCPNIEIGLIFKTKIFHF